MTAPHEPFAAPADVPRGDAAAYDVHPEAPATDANLWETNAGASAFVAAGIAALSRPSGPAAASGALVAVAALCGGAGATTVAYLVARAAAARGGPALVGDVGGPTAALADVAGVESQRSLTSLADAVAASEPLAERLLAEQVGSVDGLRVVASRPAFESEPDRDGWARTLGALRAAHPLSVVDCGVPGDAASRQLLELATHVVWVLPATDAGIRRGRRVLGLFGIDGDRNEVIVARNDRGARKATIGDLKELAHSRNAPLVLMPELPQLDGKGLARALDEAGLSLDAILMALRR